MTVEPRSFFSLPRVVPCFPLLGLTPTGLLMGLSSTIIYTSELILCSTIYVKLLGISCVKTIAVTERYALINRAHKQIFNSPSNLNMSPCFVLFFAWLPAIVCRGGVKNSVKYSREFESNQIILHVFSWGYALNIYFNL